MEDTCLLLGLRATMEQKHSKQARLYRLLPSFTRPAMFSVFCLLHLLLHKQLCIPSHPQAVSIFTSITCKHHHLTSISTPFQQSTHQLSPHPRSNPHLSIHPSIQPNPPRYPLSNLPIPTTCENVKLHLPPLPHKPTPHNSYPRPAPPTQTRPFTTRPDQCGL